MHLPFPLNVATGQSSSLGCLGLTTHYAWNEGLNIYITVLQDKLVSCHVRTVLNATMRSDKDHFRSLRVTFPSHLSWNQLGGDSTNAAFRIQLLLGSGDLSGSSSSPFGCDQDFFPWSASFSPLLSPSRLSSFWWWEGLVPLTRASLLIWI